MHTYEQKYNLTHLNFSIYFIEVARIKRPRLIHDRKEKYVHTLMPHIIALIFFINILYFKCPIRGYEMKVYRTLKTAFLFSVSLSVLDISHGASSFSSSWMRRGATSQTVHAVQTVTQSFRFCSFLPEGVTLIPLSQKGLAPWSDRQQKTKTDEHTPIDVSKFCADHERGLLYRFQSWKELEKEKETKAEKFPLFKMKTETFDRCAEHKELSGLVESMGLVESTFSIEDGQLSALGTGLLVRQDAVLTAAHNVTIDPTDSLKIKKSKTAENVEFLLRYDDGKPLKRLKVSEYKIPKEWLIGRDRAYDFAILFLENSELKTKIQLASVNNAMKLPIPTRVAGYPKEVPNTTGLRVQNEPLSSYAHSGELRKVSDCNRFLDYSCFTEEGMSGGPILIRDLPTISIGVHTTGRWDLNRGVHHSDHMIAYINKWFEERASSNNSDKAIETLIAELAATDEESTYLRSNIEKLRTYPQENLRSYISVLLDVHRK